jgi:hypothetical protein
MRRACAGCHIPLDDLGAITDPADVSHGFCSACAAAAHVEISEIPACGTVGRWGECNLFADHSGPCQRLRNYRGLSGAS